MLKKGNNIIIKRRSLRSVSKSKGRKTKLKNTGKIVDRNGPDLVQAIRKKWWVKPGFKARQTSLFHCDLGIQWYKNNKRSCETKQLKLCV